MRIFYALSIILLLSIQAQSQDRRPSQSGKDPVVRVVKFYPNPATSLITFDLQQADEKQYSQLNLQIFNLTGKKVVEVGQITPKTIVNVNDFYRGVYIFQLRDKSGKIIDSGKFQVAH
jgi:hypothetical protein